MRAAVPTATDLLSELTSLHHDFTPAAAARKEQILGALARRGLPGADAVLALHEELCFLRAYPQSAAQLRATEGLLADFDRRADVRRFRRALADSGIAGTETEFRYFWRMAIRLLERWPDAISIVWSEFGARDGLVALLPLLLPYCETPSLDALDLSSREWVDTLRGPDETDAAFLIRLFSKLPVPTPVCEKLYEDLDIPIVMRPGPDTPARGREHWPRAPVVLQAEPPGRRRPDLRRAVTRERFTVRDATRREARELIDLANRCMVSRHRDLLVFLYADERDVRVVDFGDGLQFACMGAVPERRLMLESVYGFLTLMNGVPTGYVLCSAFMGSSEVAYNVFETFRGAGAALTYARILAMVHGLFGSDTFAVDPYQLGHDNSEGLASGAWWFYYKLGFRPHDAYVRGLVREELALTRAQPRRRTPVDRLQELSSAYMFLHLGRPRRDVLGHVALGNIGLHVNHHLARRFGGDREQGLDDCADEAGRLLDLRAWRDLPRDERLVWRRWAPLVLVLPGVSGWTAAQRRGLRDVVRAKGSRREEEYVRLLDAHRPLRQALLRLARSAP